MFQVRDRARPLRVTDTRSRKSRGDLVGSRIQQPSAGVPYTVIK